MARVSLRLRFASDQRLGPGKVRLLELIAETGSISAAGRAMNMSYRRAWNLVAELNAMFADQVVDAQPGGRNGGGARLTELGADIVRRYRAIETNVARASRAHIVAFEKLTIMPDTSRRAPRTR